MSSNWWATLSGRHVEVPQAVQQNLALRIDAAGLCCAVGYQLRAAACAIRANMDHFQDSEFVCAIGEAIRVARLPDCDCWGSKRLARWIAFSVRDCLSGQAHFDASRCALVVLAAEPERPDMADEPYRDIIIGAMSELGLRFHESSRILPLGRAGLALALCYAEALLASGELDCALLVGADSLLSASAIDHSLCDERLMVPGNRDGFLPGEAAAAVLLSRAGAAAEGLVIRGWGEAIERSHWDNEIPNRSQGLAQAVRLACDAARLDPLKLEFRVSDQNGESYYTREAGNAFTRLLFSGGKIGLLTLADKIGEVGAATGVAALAFLSDVMLRPDCSPGQVGVVHLANDNGRRCAVIVQAHS